MIRIFLNRSVLFFAIAVVLLSACRSTQVNTAVTDADIRNAIDSNSWVFTVQQVMPLYGRARQPNGDYTVVCNGQKLEVYLPYFGRATAGVDVYSGRGPLDFSTDKAVIEKQQGKPGEWRVQAESRDAGSANNGLYFLCKRNSAPGRENDQPQRYKL